MGNEKVAFISTVLNEESTIKPFIDSILNQTKLPSEIIFVDGGSCDSTLSIIYNLQLTINKKNKFKILIKKGNRAVGRNEAIKNAKSSIIVISDAGCILDHRFVEKVTKPFKNNSVDVVAGYYQGKAENIFEKCLIPYVLVTEDAVDSNNFLPSSRSMALRRDVWTRLGGFDERLSHNEDYAFAKKIKKSKLKITFQKDAVVTWIPRKSFKEAFIMFYRFAYGDIEASILRPKVGILFIRYIFGLILVISFLIYKDTILLWLLGSGFLLYLLYSIKKNYRYVKNWRALYFLPAMQLLSDIAVILGSLRGFLKRTLNYII